MELRHLRSFLAVAEHLHFRRAAETIHLSEPALSVQIRTLEEEIGVQLFVRDRRRTLLTPAGQVFLEEAREMVVRSERALGRARRAALGQVGILRVGFVSTAAALLIPPLVMRFREFYPDVELDLRNVLTADQVVQLSDGRLDVGLLRLPITAQEQIETTVLHREPFILLLPASHPLARKRPLRLQHLGDANFVMYARKQAPAFHDRILGILNGAGFSPHVVQEASEMHTLVSLVAAGLGIALAPSSVQLLHHLPGVVVRKLPRRLPLSEIALAVRKHDTAATTRLFVDVALATHGVK
ncbi:MAG: LysR family transcriptional regulator [Candidatus Acidiferrales bacterium]|jgi:DNA-binding transcriptional LysR family regulator